MSRNTDQLAVEWIEARGVARSYAQQRLPVLADDTAELVRGLMDRLTALRLPDTRAELQERRWQFQGFMLMVGAVTYADRVRPARRSQWLDVTRRVQEFCDEPFPTDADGLQRLWEVFSSWYGDVERVLRSRDPRSETSGAWVEVVPLVANSLSSPDEDLAIEAAAAQGECGRQDAVEP